MLYVGQCCCFISLTLSFSAVKYPSLLFSMLCLYLCVCVCLLVCACMHLCVCVGGGGAFVGRRLGSEGILCCSDVRGCIIPTTATKSVHFDSKNHCYAF